VLVFFNVAVVGARIAVGTPEAPTGVLPFSGAEWDNATSVLGAVDKTILQGVAARAPT